jgi:hypothetical protein
MIKKLSYLTLFSFRKIHLPAIGSQILSILYYYHFQRIIFLLTIKVYIEKFVQIGIE